MFFIATLTRRANAEGLKFISSIGHEKKKLFGGEGKEIETNFGAGREF